MHLIQKYYANGYHLLQIVTGRIRNTFIKIEILFQLDAVRFVEEEGIILQDVIANLFVCLKEKH